MEASATESCQTASKLGRPLLSRAWLDDRRRLSFGGAQLGAEWQSSWPGGCIETPSRDDLGTSVFLRFWSNATCCIEIT